MLTIFKKNLKHFRKGGVHPAENKLSEEAAIEEIGLPKSVNIPISQHIGAPATVVVERGDMVKVGQVIAKHEGFVSSNIHASVSGKVGKIDKMMDTTGFKRVAINIRVKGDDWMEDIDRTDQLIKEIPEDPQEIIRKIMEAGVVGQGGAAFPSHVKLTVPEGKHVDTLVVNGVECEPYLTADHRLMLEKPHEIMVGTQLLMKTLNVKRAIIGIENNKGDAIALLSSVAKDYPGIEVESLRVQYPQGGEKQLIEAVLDREVPSGGLPADVGCVVHNVGTIYTMYLAVQKNQPLVERVVTVTGREIKKPSNFKVRVGTPVTELLDAAGGLPERTGKVVSGGPMMGKALNDLTVPVAKATSGILVIPAEESARDKVYPCVQCGKCIASCPMGLEPRLLMQHGQKKQFEEASQLNVMDCLECGSCSFICPSNRPILDYIRVTKSKIKKGALK